MTIILNTDQTIAQQLQNVEDIYRAIEQHYYVPHVKRCDSSQLLIQFGRHPIRENTIQFSPHGKPRATLLVYINDQLCQKLTGYSTSELGKQQDALRTEKGNDVANAFPRTFNAKLDAAYGAGIVQLNISTYMSAKVSLTVNIEQVTGEVVSAISDILKHSGMLPKSKQAHNYSL